MKVGTDSKRKVCININFDPLYLSLYKKGQGFKDPSYFQVGDRFMRYADDYGFKYTIFMVGCDLKDPEVFSRVRDWALAGHEIGNHSWSHPLNFGALSRSLIREEILRSHDIITRCTGREPRGFISPGWSLSGDIIDILLSLGYLYDTSVFPSPLIALALFKLGFKVGDHRQFDGSSFSSSWMRRRDKLAAFFAPRQPYFICADSLIKRNVAGLLELPLPALPMRIPCWHTLAFYLGGRGIRWLIRKACAATEVFYYVTHPADLADYEHDFPEEIRHRKELQIFERLQVPAQKKWFLFREVIEEIQGLGKIVTLEEIALEIIEKIRLRERG